MTKRALVLGGGGARGAFQVGMLDVLVRERGIDFDVIRGVSVGALNAAFLAQAPTGANSLANLQAAVTELVRIWTEEIRGNASIFEERATGFAGLAAGADSLLDNEPLWDLIRKHVDPAKLESSRRDFAVGVASLVTGEFHERRPSSKDFLRLVLASTAIPVVFPPVWRREGREVFVDGGVREITPLSTAFRAKPDEIYVLMASRAVRDAAGEIPGNTAMPTRYEDWDDNFLGTRVSGLDVLKRTVEILTDEIYLDDVRGALEWNGVLDKTMRLLGALAESPGDDRVTAAAQALHATIAATKKRAVPIHVLAPRQWYGDTNSATAFDPSLIEAAIEHGRDVARDATKWLWP